jgi:hypothetical protein
MVISGGSLVGRCEGGLVCGAALGVASEAKGFRSNDWGCTAPTVME